MCRNIKTLYNFEPPATKQEVEAACRQFIRKVSGFNKPSVANQQPIEHAIEEVSATVHRLFAQLQTSAPAKDREAEAAKAKARAAKRFGARAS